MTSFVQIPNLPAATTLGGTEQFEAVQAGVSCRVTAAQIAALVRGGIFANWTGLVVTSDGGQPVVMSGAYYELVIRKASGSATAVFLPSNPSAFTIARVSDGKGDAGANPISVTAPGGGAINGSASAVVIGSNWGTAGFRALSATEWTTLP